jgi:Protein of unknown function (DUF1631)
MDRTTTKVPVILDENHRRVLLECRDLSLVFFTAQLGDMYSNVNDALWDFADKAENNEFQRRYIDAATIVTGGRSDLEFMFRELISKGFSDFTAGRHIADVFDNVPREYSDKGELALVSNDAIEEYVAIQNIVDKTKSNCYQHLYALGQRLSLIRGGVKANDFDIPAGPLHSIYSFSKAIESFELAMDINLVLFFLFEKYVMKEMGSVYEGFNEHLINAGIFPNLKMVAPKNPSSKRVKKHHEELVQEQDLAAFVPAGLEQYQSGDASQSGQDAGTAGEGGGQGISVGEEIFGSICSLLAMRRKHDPLYELHPELNPNAPPVVMTTKPALLAVIDDIQNTVSKSYTQVSPPGGHADQSYLINPAVLEQIRKIPFEEQNKLFDGVDRRKIPSADLDTIELVGMLFEYVLNDKELPNVVKALISHLHTPFLKVAVIDQEFLINDQHVARKLLDLMLDAGRNWVDEKQLAHGAFYPMERQVERIIHEFQEDMLLFDEILEDFKKDINMLEQKAISTEERSREAERGRDRLEAARRQAKNVIIKRIGTRELPSLMKRFLFQIWMYRMTLMLVRNPNAEETKAWKKTLMIIDTLLWSLDAPKDKAKQQKLCDIYPALKRQIEKGLASVSDYYEPEAQALFDLLLSYQSEVIQVQEGGIQLEVVIPEQETKLEEPVSESVEGDELDNLVPHVDETPVVVEEVEPNLSHEEEHLALRLRNTEFGTWFEILDYTTGDPIRAKLSWFSPLTKRYMFVDRNGVQVAVRPLKTLVSELSEGTALIIDTSVHSFLDNAMQSIKEMLERATGPLKAMTSRQ